MNNRIRLSMEHLVEAAESLWANRLRSGLTIIGVVIGVMTVTGVASMIQGLNSQITGSLGSLGTRTLYIHRTPPSASRDEGREVSARRVLETSYAGSISTVPGVEAAVPISETTATIKAADGLEFSVQLVGTTEDWPLTSHMEMESGRFFSSFEARAAREICVIGADISERLFGSEDPAGRTVQVNGTDLVVLGTLESFGEMMGHSRDNVIVIPQALFSRWADPGEHLSIAVEVEAGGDVEAVKTAVEALMRRLRGLGADEENDFAVTNSEDLLEMYTETSQWVYTGMLAISAIALIVGSVGIANIMLVSVTERTREIGLRMALGATRGQLLGQFLTESVMLSLAGGVVGTVAGGGLALVISVLTPIPAGLQVWSAAVALLVSFLVGISAGVFPAMRAAGLDPVTALNRDA